MLPRRYWTYTTSGSAASGEPQDLKGPVHRRMRPGSVRQDLQHDLVGTGDVQQVQDLIVHRGASANLAAQSALVQHDPHLGSVIAGQLLLTLHPHSDAPFQLMLGGNLDVGEHQRADVAFGLQAAVDRLGLVGPDLGDFAFDADVDLEPGGIFAYGHG